MTTSEILQGLYDSEINYGIFCFWDAGIEFNLGDPTNGIRATEVFYNYKEGVNWLAGKAIEKYPDSDFARKGRAK